MTNNIELYDGKVKHHRKLRFHDEPFHASNWCEKCGLHYCWHPVCQEHRQDARANHEFKPEKEDL